jgi:CP family cyanate transporter-like MFS transporter
VLAALFWLPAVIARHGDPLPPRPPVASLWRDRTAWLVTGFFASQSTLFYATLAWVPDIMRAQGISSSTAGVLLSVAMGLGAPSALVVPVIAAKMRRQTPLAAGAVGLWTAGLLGLLLAPSGGALIWMILIGLGQGAGISLSLTLFVLRTPDGAHAAAMSGMANTVAYGLAAVGPFALGALHDLSGGWQLPIAVMLGICGTMLLCGLGASKPKMVLER